jgi:hypothetical protein
MIKKQEKTSTYCPTQSFEQMHFGGWLLLDTDFKERFQFSHIFEYKSVAVFSGGVRMSWKTARQAESTEYPVKLSFLPPHPHQPDQTTVSALPEPGFQPQNTESSGRRRGFSTCHISVIVPILLRHP